MRCFLVKAHSDSRLLRVSNPSADDLMTDALPP